MRAWQAAHPGYAAASVRRRRITDAEAMREYERLRWHRDAEYRRKKSARIAVQVALKRGKLVRPLLCDACNGGGEIEAHHEDYDRPLDVRWLCRTCHAQEHVH